MSGRPRFDVSPELERRREQYRRSSARKYERVRHDRGECSDPSGPGGQHCPLNWARQEAERRPVDAPKRLVVTLRDGRRVFYYPDRRVKG